jgi:hypothetical protein
MEFFTFFSGISSFIITGTDDLIVLIYFYMLYRSKFKWVICGTLIGLIAVMIPSLIFAKLLVGLDVSKYISTDLILSCILAYIGYGLIKESIQNKKDDFIDNLKELKSFQVMVLSGGTYFINGLDDFVVYSGFYMKYDTLYEIFLFSIGIMFGLVFFAFISYSVGKKFLEIEEKFQNDIKLLIGGLVLISALYIALF